MEISRSINSVEWSTISRSSAESQSRAGVNPREATASAVGRASLEAVGQAFMANSNAVRTRTASFEQDVSLPPRLQEEMSNTQLRIQQLNISTASSEGRIKSYHISINGTKIDMSNLTPEQQKVVFLAANQLAKAEEESPPDRVVRTVNVARNVASSAFRRLKDSYSLIVNPENRENPVQLYKHSIKQTPLAKVMHTLGVAHQKKSIGSGSYKAVHLMENIALSAHQPILGPYVRAVVKEGKSVAKTATSVYRRIENSQDPNKKYVLVSHKMTFEKKGVLREAWISPHCSQGDFWACCTGENPISPKQKKELLVQLAKGLKFFHENGIVHCDLKPENLFLTTDERGKLLLKIADNEEALLFDRSGKIDPTFNHTRILDDDVNIVRTKGYAPNDLPVFANGLKASKNGYGDLAFERARKWDIHAFCQIARDALKDKVVSNRFAQIEFDSRDRHLDNPSWDEIIDLIGNLLV